MPLVFLFFCPILALLIAVRKPQSQVSQYVIVLFWGIVGLTRTLIFSEDAARQNMYMEMYSHMNYSKFIEDRFLGAWTEDFNILHWHVLYFLSKIGYTAIAWAIIMMCFTTIIIKCFLLQKESDVRMDNLTNRKYIPFFFLLSLFFLPISSYGVKFWTAMLFFLWGIYVYLYKENAKGILLLLLSSSFHYTFIYAILVFLYFFLTRNRSIWIKIVFLIGLMGMVYMLMPHISDSEFLREKVEDYSDNIKRGEYFSSKALWIIGERYILGIFSAVSILYFRRKNISDKKSREMLHLMFLFMIGLVPLFSYYDALDRFSRVLAYMTLLFIVRILWTNEMISRFYLNVSVVVFLYHAITMLYLRNYDWDFVALINNPIITVINTSMTTILKH